MQCVIWITLDNASRVDVDEMVTLRFEPEQAERPFTAFQVCVETLSYLDASLQAGTVVAQVEVHRRRPVGPVRAWPWRGALLEAWTREEEREGTLEEACLSTETLHCFQ